MGESIMKRKCTLMLWLLFFHLILLGFPASSMALTPFESMDRNQDGQLSRSEFRGPHPVFIRLDRDKNGYVSKTEASGTRLLGELHPRKQIEKSPPAPMSAELLYVDTHNHLVGPRKMGRYHIEKPAGIALEAMNATGVKINLLMPMPQTANQKFRVYYEDLLPMVERYPHRFAALGGGGSLNVMIQ